MKKIIKMCTIVVAMLVLMCTSVSAASDIIEGEAECPNPKKSSDHHTESCTRTKTWSGSVGGSAKTEARIIAIKASVTVNAEVGYSKLVSTTSSHTWDIDPKSTYICQWGSRSARTTGTMNYWVNGIKKTSSTVDTGWTTRSYYGGYYE